MDVLKKHFLDIIKTALRGQRVTGYEDLTVGDWKDLFAMAQTHSLLPLFYEAVFAVPVLQSGEAPFVAAVRQQVKQQVLVQTIRTSDFLELNRKLREAGVKPLVVKGIICRNLYPKPDHRMSSDEDVLIKLEQFERCHEVMQGFGLRTQEEALASYEVPYRSKNGSPLYIELHKHLFPPESEAYGELNRFFEGVFDRAIEEQIQEEQVWTMGYTDHLFYLICHAFKHFLHSGFGIRQVCDIVMYANRYGSQVDWFQVLECCEVIRAERFAAALLKIGEKYLGFDPEKAGYPRTWRALDVDETAMLEDLLSGGLYGDASMSRKHSSNITLDAVVAQKRGEKAKYSVLAAVFPSAARLEGKYPYLRRHPYLLPFAWASRLWKYNRETKTVRDNTPTDAMRIGAERVELLRQYRIVD